MKVRWKNRTRYWRRRASILVRRRIEDTDHGLVRWFARQLCALNSDVIDLFRKYKCFRDDFIPDRNTFTFMAALNTLDKNTLDDLLQNVKTSGSCESKWAVSVSLKGAFWEKNFFFSSKLPSILNTLYLSE